MTIGVVALGIGAHAIPTPAAAQTEPCPSGGQVTINRTIPVDYPTPATFVYEVRDPSTDDVVDKVTITFDGSSTYGQAIATTPSGATGQFKVVEVDRPTGFVPSPDAIVQIDPATDCADAVTYNSSIHPLQVRVVKTETVGARRRDEAIGKWTFTLTGGPDDVSLTKTTNTKGNSHILNFSVFAAPGAYTLCERFTGWKSNLGKRNGSYRPNGDRCVSFFLAERQTLTFRVNNRCPMS